MGSFMRSYVKPNLEYFSYDYINAIEAKMSAGYGVRTGSTYESAKTFIGSINTSINRFYAESTYKYYWFKVSQVDGDFMYTISGSAGVKMYIYKLVGNVAPSLVNLDVITAEGENKTIAGAYANNGIHGSYNTYYILVKAENLSAPAASITLETLKTPIYLEAGYAVYSPYKIVEINSVVEQKDETTGLYDIIINYTLKFKCDGNFLIYAGYEFAPNSNGEPTFLGTVRQINLRREPGNYTESYNQTYLPCTHRAVCIAGAANENREWGDAIYPYPTESFTYDHIIDTVDINYTNGSVAIAQVIVGCLELVVTYCTGFDWEIVWSWVSDQAGEAASCRYYADGKEITLGQHVQIITRFEESRIYHEIKVWQNESAYIANNTPYYNNNSILLQLPDFND